MDTAALKNQAWGVARGGIWFAAGVTVGRGWLNGETALTIAGAVLTVVAGGATGVANSNSSIVQAASQVPEVKAMAIADAKLAAAAAKADPETKVILDPPQKEEK
jgi:hypothetical protein